ncbi:MAG: BamA/TamA family outer membrane protein [Myxococcota bacterium]
MDGAELARRVGPAAAARRATGRNDPLAARRATGRNDPLALLLARAWLLAVGLLLAGSAGGAETDPLDALDRDLEWRVADIEIEGNETIPTSEIRRVIETHRRARLAFWRKRPSFDPVVFERDRERITRLYETEGFYRSRIDWRVDVRHEEEAERLTLFLRIEEGPRARVAAIEIDPPDPTLVPNADASAKRGSYGRKPARRWALAVGDPFREADYQRLETQLRAAYLDRGFARVDTTRSARVGVDRESVTVHYTIRHGPPARFGEITIDGLEKIDRDVVGRELTFDTGDPFSLSRIEESRRRIQALDLFASIQMDWSVDPDQPEVAPIRITLNEKKHRELRVGAGYSTEARANANVRWQSKNFFGGARRMLVSGRYSNLVRSADLAFVQPYLFDRRNRGLLELALFQQDEPNFTRNSIQGIPAFERSFTRDLVATFGLRFDTAEIRDVETQVQALIGGVRSEGTVIGPRFSLRWTPVDDVARPRDGLVASFETQYSSRAFGATFDYVRLVGEVAVFQPVFEWAVVAGRLKLGAAQAFGSPERLPIFERLYAGGEGSVRGYRRHQLGPTAGNGNPLGGRSLIEGSVEARIPVWRNIGVVGFLDFGQLSLERWGFVPDELRFSAGPGISYMTPIGPISLFAGFPLNGQPGEPPWQIHFNIGFFF